MCQSCNKILVPQAQELNEGLETELVIMPLAGNDRRSHAKTESEHHADKNLKETVMRA